MTPILLFGHGPDVLSTQWVGPFNSRDEAVRHGRSTYGKTHSFYVIRGEPLRIEDFIPKANDLTQIVLDDIWMTAYEKHGDHADAFPDLADVSAVAREELYMLIRSWVQRRLRNGWAPTGRAERIEPLTQLALIPCTPIETNQQERQIK
jgi:hypothetical protein